MFVHRYPNQCMVRTLSLAISLTTETISFHMQSGGHLHNTFQTFFYTVGAQLLKSLGIHPNDFSYHVVEAKVLDTVAWCKYRHSRH